MKRAPRLWRGTIRVDALLFATSLIDGADATARILAAWEPGAVLARCEAGWLLRFPKSRWMRAQESPGQVLVRVGALWSALRIVADDAAQWPARSLLHARDGIAIAVPVPEQSIDPSVLLDLSAFELEPLAALTSPRPVVRRAVPVEAPPSTREILEVGEAAEEAVLFTRSLKGLPAESPSRSGSGSGSGSGTADGLLAAIMRWFSRGSGGEGGIREAASRGTPIMDRLRSLMNRVILATRLGSMMGWRQAQYMSDLVDMLERQRFDEALRYAIPLSDDVVSSLGRVSFLRPSPRDDFSLSLTRVQASTVMAGGGDVASRLRELYRRAAEALEREGKIERAAFVLADLLNLPEEAVSLLERHQKLRLAARLAEARNLHPGLVVRQWLLAGDRTRAIALARRHDAYAVAVGRLETSHPELASMLRVEWAETLAARGAFTAAVHAIWPVEHERARATIWLDEAIAGRGVSGARALARKLELVEDDRRTTLEQIADVLAEEDAETATARMMLVSTLAMKPSPIAEVRSALRLGLRSQLRDATALSRPWKAPEMETLVKAAGDGALRADLPSPPSRQPRVWSATTEAISHAVDEADRGMSEVHDAVMLEDGVVAVALGESGCVLLHRDGRTIARLSEPVYQFVLSDLRDRALALAPRNESWRISRIDFVKRRAVYWRDVRLHAFADSYDGATWFAAVDGALHAIDTTAEPLASVWYNPDVGTILRMVRTPTAVALLNFDGELWQYEIPSYLLRQRERVVMDEKEAETTAAMAPLPNGGLVDVQIADEGKRTVVRTGRTKAERIIGIFDGALTAIVPHERWIAVLVDRDGNSHVSLLEPATGRVRVQVMLGASNPRVRIQAEHFLVFDDAGRIVVVDLEHGTLLRDLRI